MQKLQKQNETRDIKSQKMYRECSICKDDINKEDRTVALSFASEQPVQQWFGEEQLIITPQSVDLSRVQSGLCCLLNNHDANQVIGIVENAVVTDSRVKSLVRFSKSEQGEEVYQDVLDGIRQGVSFGYTIDDYTATDNGIIVNKLTVFEVSICSIPAATDVGVNRELANVQTNNEIEDQNKMEVEKEVVTAPVISESEREAIITSTRSTEMKRINEIDAISNGNVAGSIDSIRELAKSAKEKGESVESFRTVVLGELEKRQAPVSATAKTEFSGSDIKEFSLSRAINASLTGDYSNAKFERSLMDHAANKSGRGNGGTYIPFEVLNAKRDLSTAATGAVSTSTRYDLAINPLYANSVTAQLGATVLNGLNGVVQIPKLATSFTVNTEAGGTFVENTGGTEADGTFDQLVLSPNALASSATYSKQLLTQSGSNVDSIIVNDILKQIPLALDKIAIAKIVSAATPITCAATLTYAHILALETACFNANINPMNLAFATSPQIASILKGLPKCATGLADFVMKGGSIDDYKAVVSAQMIKSSTGMILAGDWAELYIAYFGNGLEIVTDGISLANKMQVRITASVLADVGVRHAAAFAKITDAHYA